MQDLKLSILVSRACQVARRHIGVAIQNGKKRGFDAHRDVLCPMNFLKVAVRSKMVSPGD